jgi:ArsR family transcriptional regulator
LEGHDHDEELLDECDSGEHGLDHPRPDAEHLERAAALFSAMGDPGRLDVLVCLFHAEHCVSDLAAELDQGLSTISQRLKILRQQRLVSRRRDGKHIYYALADAHIEELVSSALDHVSE